jgi:hypothetical protein
LPERKELFSSGGPDGFLIDRRPPPPHPPLPPRSGGRPPKPLVGIPSSLQGGTNAVIQSWTGRVVIRIPVRPLCTWRWWRPGSSRPP